MKRLAFVTLGLMIATNSAYAQNFSSEDLIRRTIERRAVEAIIWGMPAVNAELMFGAMNDAGADFNQVVYWSRPVSWKNQTLTPNPDTIYLMPFYNTKDAGPMVLEIPPAEEEASITGSIDDAWQTALEDVGPAGVDKGKGGKYLILPPGYKEKASDGYIALPADTYAGFVLLRSNLKSGSDADIAKAVAYGKRVKFYPLSQAANPPETIFVDAIDVVYDSTIPYDLRFFQSFDRFAQREPWLERDKAMIDQLKSIGIEKGTHSSRTTERRRFSTTPRAKRMPGSISNTKASSHRRSMRAATGHFLPSRMWSKACRRISPSPAPILWRAVASPIPWRISAPSTWGQASST
ncbi:MAG TPA: DUF1254 domain-containing protein [Nitrospiraceae bacterium]|nr:DUF1254 domain-containing protein [Nitrospiraceae bacterium]